MENKDSYLSKKEWILSITGIIVLVLLIALPPVFRIAFKEKKDKEEFVDEINISKLVCTKNNDVDSDNVTISYYKDKVRTYNIKSVRTYSTVDEFDDVKQKKAILSTAYDLVEGISFSVNADDATLKLTTVEECNLGTFKAMEVTVPGNADQIKVDAIYNTKDSVDAIKQELQDEGYTCR